MSGAPGEPGLPGVQAPVEEGLAQTVTITDKHNHNDNSNDKHTIISTYCVIVLYHVCYYMILYYVILLHI